VELYEQIRREYEHGAGTIRAVARKLGVHRREVRKALTSAVPAERKIPERERPRLAAAIPFIDGILESDRQAPRKQRHTAHRIFTRLRRERPRIDVARGRTGLSGRRARYLGAHVVWRSVSRRGRIGLGAPQIRITRAGSIPRRAGTAVWIVLFRPPRRGRMDSARRATLIESLRATTPPALQRFPVPFPPQTTTRTIGAPEAPHPRGVRIPAATSGARGRLPDARFSLSCCYLPFGAGTPPAAGAPACERGQSPWKC
jgi:hypothetical protein